MSEATKQEETIIIDGTAGRLHPRKDDPDAFTVRRPGCSPLGTVERFEAIGEGVIWRAWDEDEEPIGYYRERQDAIDVVGRVAAAHDVIRAARDAGRSMHVEPARAKG